MSLRSAAMRAAVAATVTGAALLPVTPSEAVPPLLITGTGTISPGLIVPCCVYPVSVSFSGTGTIGALTFDCSFSGSGQNVPTGGASGTLGGSCGPISYTGCVFTLSPTTWEIVCATSVGTFAVSYLDLNPTTRFSATGAMA